MIRRLELHNFATHQDTEIEFENGKNVIIGATGSGKTNLLQGLDFAFNGEVPGANLTELVADDADSATVILDYIEPRTGQSYRIHRILTRNEEGKVDHDCSLTNLDTSESVKKPAPVQKTLETLGVIPSVFRHVVHVAQGGFSDLLEESQERKSSMDRLFQISHLENAYQELGHHGGPINQIEMRRQKNLETKSKLEAIASTLQSEKELLKRIIDERQKKQGQLENNKKEHARIEQTSEKNLKLLTKLQDTEGKINSANASTASNLEQTEKSLSRIRELLSPQIGNLLEEKTSKETLDYLETLKSNLKNIQLEIDSLDRTHQQNLAQAASTQSQINLANEEQTNASNQITTIQMYLEGKGDQPQIECDKCGSILTKEQWVTHIEEKNNSIVDLKSKIIQLQNQYDQEKSLIENCQRKLDEANINHRKLTSAALVVEQLVTQRQEIEKTSEFKILLEEEKAKLVGELRSLLQAKPTARDKEIIDEALALNQKLQTLSEQITHMKEDLDLYDENHLKPQEKRVTAAEEAATQLKKLEPEIQLDQNKISLLNLIRVSLREIQPAVRRNFVSKITQSANDYLTRLYDSSEIQNFELTEDYAFFVTRAGYKRHANRLSGGQQVLASMAFLLALSEVLSQLDFLILDEPTTHLDTNRRIELVTVLENLRRVPQLIIVDHHPELFEAADTRFQITLDPEGHSKMTQLD